MSNEIDKKDGITKLCSQAIDIIFISNPRRTSFGVLLGIVLKGGTDIAMQVLDKQFDTTYIFWISLGILLFHIPDSFLHHRIDEKLETEMYYLLEAQKHGEFTATEKRAQWRDFIRLIHKFEFDNQEDAENKDTDIASV